MPSYVLFDGTSSVSLSPGYDIKTDHRKIENEHRTRSGAGYKYTWGRYRRAEFNVEFVSSADACQINSWWNANTTLRLYDMSSVVVVSGYISGNAAPISQLVAPYSDQFRGIIMLEAY